MPRTPTLLLAFAAALPAWPQLTYFPSAASSQLYFPQLADGGPTAQKWATTLLVVNASATTAASVAFSFYDDQGQPLALDFGGGAQPTLNVNLPAGGVKMATSSGASASMATGWGVATSNVPITGTVLYEARQNGTPLWDVAASGAAPTYLYTSFANASLGIALANPGANPISLNVIATDQNGNAAGNTSVQLGPNGHTAIGLATAISGLPASFMGSITITSANGSPTPFVAWTVNSRDGLLSPLPPGGLTSPAPGDHLVGDVAAEMRIAGAGAIQDFGTLISGSYGAMANVVATLQCSIDANATLTISYNAADQKIHASTAMVEAMGDSRAAMGFLAGHYATVAAQQQVGIDQKIVTKLGGLPLTADTVGMIAVMKAGLDPLGAMDFYGRMQYAIASGVPVDPNVVTEFGLSNVPARLAALWQDMSLACGFLPALSQDCQAMHTMWHPDVSGSPTW
jgi:hypothetical protein